MTFDILGSVRVFYRDIGEPEEALGKSGNGAFRAPVGARNDLSAK